ncbi:MAG: hypothetical protein OEZ39_18505 [Gammaproteobacteria bacterium]|nr:hypothetical protein [Gammaproteobacteria bacterium]MDH5653859.1 hypothetical protein [Gammaproteobacteria bacterium]
MHQLGRIAVYLGITLITAGVIIGFTAMFLDKDNHAVNWLAIIPVGFVVLLLGTVMTQLAKPDQTDRHEPD